MATKKNKKTKKKKEKVEAGINRPVSTPEKTQAKQAMLQTPMPPPAFISDAIKEAKKKPEPKPEDDDVLAEGAKSDFWRILKRFIDYKLEIITSETASSVGSGKLTLEQIGFKSVLKDVVVEFGDGIKKYVEGRAAIIEQMKIDKQQEKKDEVSEKSGSE